MIQNAITIQCEQHFGSPSFCRLVQLRHRVGIADAWQEPRWVCEHCRSLMPGQFRYCDAETSTRYLAITELRYHSYNYG